MDYEIIATLWLIDSMVRQHLWPDELTQACVHKAQKGHGMYEVAVKWGACVLYL